MLIDLSALVPARHWECPNCDAADVTREAEPHTRFHTCAGLRGLTAPMVPAGTRCKVEATERGDYVREGSTGGMGSQPPRLQGVRNTRSGRASAGIHVLLACV